MDHQKGVPSVKVNHAPGKITSMLTILCRRIKQLQLGMGSGWPNSAKT